MAYMDMTYIVLAYTVMVYVVYGVYGFMAVEAASDDGDGAADGTSAVVSKSRFSFFLVLFGHRHVYSYVCRRVCIGACADTCGGVCRHVCKFVHR